MIGKYDPHLFGIGSERISLYSAELTMLCRRSAAKTKRRGDNGSPCLTPLLQWNTFPGTPFKRIADVPEPIIIFIQFIHF
jgi:hypothetical protein